MKPYHIVEETEESVTYEFRSIYIYILYGIMAVMFAGFITNTSWLSSTAIALLCTYFALVSLPYIPLHRKFRTAMRASSLELSGSKWSFRRPLRVTMKQDVPTQESE
jgi:hypothetical protein